MPHLLHLLVRAALPCSLAIAAWWMAVPAATFAYGLYQFEQGDPATYWVNSSLHVDRRGAGPLAVVVVEPINDVYRDGIGWGPETVRVLPSGEHQPPAGSRPTVVHDGRVGHYEEAPAPDGAWVRYALGTGLLALVGLAMAGMALATWRPLRGWAGQVIFGHREPATRDVNFVPGTGGRGAGQVPPFVPYNADWDPRNRRPPRRRKSSPTG